MTEFAPAIRTNTAIVLALAERSCSRGAIVRATRFHVPQLSSTRGSPRPLCRIRTSALPSPKPALQRAEPGARAGLCGTTQMPAISIEGDDFGRGSLVPRLAQRTLWLVVGRCPSNFFDQFRLVHFRPSTRTLLVLDLDPD